MKQIIILLFALSTTFYTIGQEYFSIGINYLPSSLNSKEKLYPYYFSESAQFNSSFGIHLTYQWSSGLFLRIESNLQKRELINDCIFIPTSDTPSTSLDILTTSDNCTHSVQGSYLLLSAPLSIGYRFLNSKKINIYTGVGISPLLKLKRKEKREDVLTGQVTNISNGKEILSWFQTKVFIGFNYNLNKRLTFSIEPTYNVDNIRSFTNTSIGIRMGIDYIF